MVSLRSCRRRPRRRILWVEVHLCSLPRLAKRVEVRLSGTQLELAPQGTVEARKRYRGGHGYRRGRDRCRRGPRLSPFRLTVVRPRLWRTVIALRNEQRADRRLERTAPVHAPSRRALGNLVETACVHQAHERVGDARVLERDPQPRVPLEQLTGRRAVTCRRGPEQSSRESGHSDRRGRNESAKGKRVTLELATNLLGDRHLNVVVQGNADRRWEDLASSPIW